MKDIFLITGLIFMFCSGFSQCPASGLKILSPYCEDPRALVVSDVSCTSVGVTWKGNKTKAYIVKATFSDPATQNIIEEEGASISCDDNGNCKAVVAGREGATINWTVQAVCSQAGVIIYSSMVNGPETYVPFCKKGIAINSVNSIHVYPNPAVSYLNVEFDGKISSIPEFRIFDIAGKQVYNKYGSAMAGNTENHYKLDLRNLVSGTYLLEVNNGTKINQVKFVVVHKN